MNTKSLLFVSFNQFKYYIYNPVTDTTNEVTLNLLLDLVTKYDLVVCNKHLLSKYIDNSIINNNIKDILYLYAMVFPTKFTTESISGLAKSLNINVSNDLSCQSSSLYYIYKFLLDSLVKFDYNKQNYILLINEFMSNNKWEWYETITATLKHVKVKNYKINSVWKNLPAIDYVASSVNKSASNKIKSELVLDTLYNLTKRFSNTREAQKDYSITVAKIFSTNKTKISCDSENEVEIMKPNIVFAEAGTGIGKTIGYLAAVFSFIRNNPNNSVVISTYSKALQQQILNEIKANIQDDDLFKKITVVKGNQNYVCLLNLENFFNCINKYDNGNLFLGYILRWLQETSSGDLLGGDFLPWLSNIIPKEVIFNILNRKEECLYSKCDYFKKCFITKVKEQAKTSNIIISNHSLTLLNKFNSKYVIFDEAHNLYNISDEIFCKEISGVKGIYLRQWLLGNNLTSRNNNPLLNGFQTRITNILSSYGEKESNVIDYNTENTLSNETIKNKEDIYATREIIDSKIKRLLNILNSSSSFLPTTNYLYNIESNQPKGIFEEFLYSIYQHVILHNNDLEQYYSKESYLENINEDLKDKASKLLYQLNGMLKSAYKLREELNNKLEFIEKEHKGSLIELINSFDVNCINIIREFIELLNEIDNKQDNYIYRFSIVKEEGHINNIGYFKNYMNPLEVFSQNFIPNKLGVVFTSATLLDNENEIYTDDKLLNKYGMTKNDVEIVGNIKLKSPFDYVNNSKVIILNENYSKNVGMRNKAMLQLFLAAKGGVLALFTSVARLKQDYNMLSKNDALKKKCIDILTQHSQDKHSSSSIELFKENIHSCLLGSDSLRDGIDVPGNSLRMVVFERVPWLRKNILNNTRKQKYGNNLEDESVRFKLRQAFGRLIRTNKDRGIFVILNSSCPTRLLSAFPENVEIYRITLEEAIKLSEDFLSKYSK